MFRLLVVVACLIGSMSARYVREAGPPAFRGSSVMDEVPFIDG